MSVTALASLKFLWELLKPILSDSVKERLKPKSSTKVAVERTHRLYKILGVLSELTEKFVSELSSYTKSVELQQRRPNKIQKKKVKAISSRHLTDEIYNQKRSLNQTASEILQALKWLADALQSVNPRLEIHKRELVKKMQNYMDWEFRPANYFYEPTFRESIDKLTEEDFDELQTILTQAQQNATTIKEAIEEFRMFLAQEIPFKESF